MGLALLQNCENALKKASIGRVWAWSRACKSPNKASARGVEARRLAGLAFAKKYRFFHWLKPSETPQAACRDTVASSPIVLRATLVQLCVCGLSLGLAARDVRLLNSKACKAGVERRLQRMRAIQRSPLTVSSSGMALPPAGRLMCFSVSCHLPLQSVQKSCSCMPSDGASRQESQKQSCVLRLLCRHQRTRPSDMRRKFVNRKCFWLPSLRKMQCDDCSIVSSSYPVSFGHAARRAADVPQLRPLCLQPRATVGAAGSRPSLLVLSLFRSRKNNI